MEYKTYITRKRAKFNAICGPVNIPYGTALENQGGFLMHQGQQVSRIITRLNRRDQHYQDRWNKIWADSLSQKYKRPEHEDHWIWNFDFYNAPVEDLRHIAALIGA